MGHQVGWRVIGSRSPESESHDFKIAAPRWFLVSLVLFLVVCSGVMLNREFEVRKQRDMQLDETIKYVSRLTERMALGEAGQRQLGEDTRRNTESIDALKGEVQAQRAVTAELIGVIRGLRSDLKEWKR